MVQVENAPVVPITLSVPWYANELLSAQLMGRLPDGTATVLVGDACGMTPDTEWVWALVSEASPSKILTYLDTTTVNLTTPGELAVQAGPLPENYLVPGEVYAVALLERGSSPGDLAQAEALGLRFARSVPFVADGAPSGGYVTCVPSLGTALTTEFQIATSGWYDEDFEVLMYSFYRFPLPSGMSLVADGDGCLDASSLKLLWTWLRHRKPKSSHIQEPAEVRAVGFPTPRTPAGRYTVARKQSQ